MLTRIIVRRECNLAMRSVAILMVAFALALCAASAEELNAANDLQLGRKVAMMVCANCHVVAADQPSRPLLVPPARSFESIAQDERFTVESVEKFLTTTHRGLDRPRGMPNPELIEPHLKAVAAYLLSLRK